MSKYKVILAVAGIILLGLNFPILARGGSGVTVTNADSVLNTSPEYSSTLIDTTLTVIPRVAFEYVDTNRGIEFMALPTSLQDLVNIVTARIGIEYAQSMEMISFNSIPSNLQDLINLVADRVRINYATSNRVAELNYPTNLPMPGSPCTFSGTIDLQGRSDDSGATFTAGANSTATDSTGNYDLIVPAGTYDVTAEMDRYLDSERIGENCPAGETIQLPNVTLLGGDANDDCVINILDLAFMGARFNLSTGDGNFDTKADINADGTINIQDLSVAGGNFHGVCPVGWP